MKAFIVVNETLGNATRLVLVSTFWKNIPEGGILLYDPKNVTFFKSRVAARNAILRMRKYDRTHACQARRADEYSIVRLISQEEEKRLAVKQSRRAK